MTTADTPHVLRICDRTGDTALAYSPTDTLTDEQVRAAFDGIVEHLLVTDVEKRFNEKIKAGYLAYTVPTDGSDGDVVRTFDPTAPQVVMTPPLVGG